MLLYSRLYAVSVNARQYYTYRKTSSHRVCHCIIVLSVSPSLGNTTLLLHSLERTVKWIDCNANMSTFHWEICMQFSLPYNLPIQYCTNKKTCFTISQYAFLTKNVIIFSCMINHFYFKIGTVETLYCVTMLSIGIQMKFFSHVLLWLY